MLEPLSDNIWVATRPFQFMGMETGTRMTVMRLANGRLVLHSPVQLDQELTLALRALGEPAYVLAPNRFHHLAIGDYLASFPGMSVLLAPGLDTKRGDLLCHGILPSDAPGEWRGQLEMVLFGGAPLVSEIVVFHVPSKTLVLTDLAFNFRHPKGLGLRLYLRVNGALDRMATPWLMRRLTRDKLAARESLRRVLKWDFERIVVSHGEVVEDHARLIFEDTFSWVLTG